MPVTGDPMWGIHVGTGMGAWEELLHPRAPKLVTTDPRVEIQTSYLRLELGEFRIRL